MNIGMDANLNHQFFSLV